MSVMFAGSLEFDKPIDEDTNALWRGLSSTRRMKRNIIELAKKTNRSLQDAIEEWGEDGALYYDLHNINGGQWIFDKTVVDYTNPPASQPGMWLHWVYDSGTNSLVWNGVEKFSHYVEWLEYLIEKIFKPRGYVLNGKIVWRGSMINDTGIIIVTNNVIDHKSLNDLVSIYKTTQFTDSIIKLVNGIQGYRNQNN